MPAAAFARLNRPSGNITGFATWEATLGGKWLELLSEIAPGLTLLSLLAAGIGVSTAKKRKKRESSQGRSAEKPA